MHDHDPAALAKCGPVAGRPYKVICISIYQDDLAELDRKVAELKARGHTTANRSAFIRHAVALCDFTTVPPHWHRP